jgi:hypothetical protein
MTETRFRRIPITRLWQPGDRWNDHVRAFIVRDTRGCELDEQGRINRFPASSHCFITWFLEGEAELLACGGQPRTPTQLVRDVQTEEADWVYRLEMPCDEYPPSTGPA